MILRFFLFLSFLFASFFVFAQEAPDISTTTKVERKKRKKRKVKLPKIDLSNWSVTVPAQRENGKTLVVEPPEILTYATNNELRPYMYTDSKRGAIVFYAKPTEATTPNSKYSRSELREQMVPGDNNVTKVE